MKLSGTVYVTGFGANNYLNIALLNKFIKIELIDFELLIKSEHRFPNLSAVQFVLGI